jgi:hypothetical protein
VLDISAQLVLISAQQAPQNDIDLLVCLERIMMKAKSIVAFTHMRLNLFATHYTRSDYPIINWCNN